MSPPSFRSHLKRKVDSPLFKEVVQPSADVLMHHLELHMETQVDDEVRGWTQEAFDAAG